jgi:hypothetical protein
VMTRGTYPIQCLTRPLERYGGTRAKLENPRIDDDSPRS